MHRTAMVVGIGLALAATLPSAPAISATGIEYGSHTYVSPTGVDGSGCSLTSPCATFQAALAQTTAGGEISVLGTADYGPMTITQAVSVVNGGGFEASIMVPSGGTGITINARATDAVSLRGLTIEGAGVGATGIQFNTGASLTIENTVIRNVTADGIDFYPNAPSSLSVSNLLVANNGNHGIYVYPQIGAVSGTVRAVFNRVEVNNNSNSGIFLNGVNMTTGILFATVSESIAAGNKYGFEVNSRTGPDVKPAALMVIGSVVTNNGTGLFAESGAIALTNSAVTGNTYGYHASGPSGPIYSFGNNNFGYNTSGNQGNLSTATER